MKNFSDCEIDLSRNYGGVNGNKIGILFNGQTYMLKFPPKPTKNIDMSYSNSCFSEYISCHIIQTLGLNVQETLLGRYRDKIVVACKDFEEKDFHFFDFASLKNTIIDSETNGRNTELDEILFAIEEQKIIDSSELKTFFWDLFIVDAFLGNFDRHNGNWGFLVNRNTQEFKIAPIYDCGSSLFPQNTDENFNYIMDNKKEIENRVYSVPRSSIRIKNKNINYYTFLTQTKNQDCLNSLKKITSKINIEKINKIIEETPYISNLHKLFLKTILKERKEGILEKALELNASFEKKSSKIPKKKMEKEDREY